MTKSPSNVDFQLGQTLYAPTKTGNVKTWCCNVQGESPAVMVIVTQAKLGGKSVIRRNPILVGKNIGKSNETTPYEQAVSEAESRYRKQFDKGYRTEIPTDTTKANTNALGLPKPMLAHPIDKVKDPKFPAHLQSKLDGHRAIVTKRNGGMVMYSRQGKIINTMDHILDFLSSRMSEGEFIDGELYVHGEALQKIGSYIKRKQPDSELIVYWVYDVMMDVPFGVRTQRVREIAQGDLRSSQTLNQPVRFLPTIVVETMEETIEYFEKYLECGYEGAILRTRDQKYEAGFRSRNLLKIKAFDDNEFEIVGVKEGKDRIVNGVHLKVAIFECVTPEGKEFEVTAPGDMYDKDNAWTDRKEYPGKFITVKHSGYTIEGKPWHPVALRLREDI